MVEVIYECSKCGHGEGRILADIRFDIYIECERCEEREEMPVYGRKFEAPSN